MTYRRLASLILATSAVACGGTGGTDATGDTSTGGTGGTASAGKGGAAGKAGAAGKGGTSGTSGAAGKGGAAGAAGVGGKGGGAGQGGSAGAGGVAGKAGASGASGNGGGSMPCTKGTIVCSGFNSQVCDGNGGYTDVKSCPTGCVAGIGCVTCVPNSGSCNGNTAQLCKPDGSGYVTQTCDADIGVTCDPKTFTCTGACAPNQLQSSYIGCEYWPTTVANVVWSVFPFAVAVANPAGAQPATIKVTRGTTMVTTATVMPGSLQIIKLPWVPEIKGQDCDENGGVSGDIATVFAKGGAYRLRSTTPVSVYQFNALDYKLDPSDPGYASCPGNASGLGCFSFTNDASLLLPTNALTGNYAVFTYPSWGGVANVGDYAAITATKDNTKVTFKSSTTLQAGGGLTGLTAGSSSTVMMNAGDVLQIMAQPNGSDISGSIVTADQPVQVIAGQPCVDIPNGKGACDHIEESILPLETLGSEYLMTAPHPASGNSSYELRIHGIEAGTVVTVDPPIGGMATINLGAGQTQGFGVSGDYHLTANKHFYVSQYMVGQDVAGIGDPAQSNGVPVGQYRSDYTFLAPNSYETNFVNITAAKGVNVTLDGTAVPAASFKPIGGSTYGVATVQLSNSQSHLVKSTGGTAGIIVYGYGQYTSYMYPGGLNLEKL